MKKTLLISLTILLSLSTTLNAKSRKVLFIGNSYIYSNDIPNLTKLIASNLGDTLTYSQSTPGGQTLQGHSTNPTTLNEIKKDKWDVVILQEQSQRPSFSPGQVASDVYPYAKILVDSIKSNHSCSEPMFYMTWGRKNGDVQNCPVYPPVCTYAGMQQRLRGSYLQMAQDNNASAAPVGAVWKTVRDSLPNVDLYIADESHPSLAGSYLAACVFYASIFHKNPHGSSYTGGLSSTVAERLQYFAGKIVLDSIATWQQNGNYPYANYSYTVSGTTLTFQSTTQHSSNYYWDFGDGNNSNMPNPVHTYTTQGKYKVSLTTSNNCFSTTCSDSASTAFVNVNEIDPKNKIIQIAHINNSSIVITVLNDRYNQINIYSASGVKLRSYSTDQKIQINNLPGGIYIYKLSNDKESVTGKFSIF